MTLWKQSNNNDIYYKNSRIKINNLIKNLYQDNKILSILEIGCGNGFTTN